MSDPTVELQAALYRMLSAGMSCPVYDAVPEDAAPPYVTIDYEVASNADLLACRLEKRWLYLSVWSNYPGQAEVKRLLAEIDLVLHGQRLALITGVIDVAGWQPYFNESLSVPLAAVTRLRVERKSTQRDADGRTYQGQAVISVMTQH